ncbi:Fibroblast growth factor receptor 1 [Paramuricea clavata]|uniref:Fibroblast growth factor receptor 1 n=1 Tax=Paramuricea clavata TaxID=317549 RepID=A0A6S7IRY2_PARCT|nr:Fibroblast growth factor receptor 1 [Paramuricea clavata]
MWRNVSKVSSRTKSVTLGNLDSETTYNLTMFSENRYGVGQRKSNVLQVETMKVTTDSVDVVIIVIIVLLITVVLAFVLGVVCYFRQKTSFARVNEPTLQMQSNTFKESIPGVSPEKIHVQDKLIFCPNGHFGSEEQNDYFSWKEISRDVLFMQNILGQGEFGLVVKAMLTSEETADIPVAVKSVKDIATENDRKELFKELRLMANVNDHPNIVNLVGACSRGGPLLVVVEYCEHGCLLSYLKKHRLDIPGKGTFVTSLDQLTRVRFAYDVSKGMRYLEERKIIHRDLAARNVLLGKHKIAKVSDFGLSRDIYETGLYQKTTTVSHH